MVGLGNRKENVDTILERTYKLSLLGLLIANQSSSLARPTQLGFRTLAVTLLGGQKSNVLESKNSPGLSFHTMVKQDPNLEFVWFSKIFHFPRAIPAQLCTLFELFCPAFLGCLFLFSSCRLTQHISLGSLLVNYFPVFPFYQDYLFAFFTLCIHE